MSGYIVKWITRKIFAETHLNRFGTEDPYYEEIQVSNEAGVNSIKKRKVKKRAPEGISTHDAKVYEKVKRRAYRMDLLFNLFGVRVGIANIVSIIPVVGAFMTVTCCLMIYRECLKIQGGLPLNVQAMMLFNIAIDFCLGLIPIVGDFIEVYYKASSRNLLLLEKHLVQVGEVKLGKRDHVDGISVADAKKWWSAFGGYLSPVIGALGKACGFVVNLGGSGKRKIEEVGSKKDL